MENNYFTRECPLCQKQIEYKTKISFIRALNKNTSCSSCCRKGDKNPFFGKTHTLDNITKMKNKDLSYLKTDDYKENYNKGLLNRNVNTTSHYDCWVRKYGKEIAEEKSLTTKKKLSELNSGKGNPMYGKPSPTGSGNGWSGWYKGWRFRSLLELSYVINYLEKNNLNWVTAETKKFMIPYIDETGNKRNYFPDFFIIDTNELIEIKPKNLFNSVSTLLKKEAAEKYCLTNNLKYVLTDIDKLSNEDIKKLHEKGEIKFIDRYNKKWLEKLH